MKMTLVERALPISIALAVVLAVVASVAMALFFGPILFPAVVVLLFLVAAVILAARSDPAAGTSRWKVFAKWAATGPLVAVALDFLFLTIVILGAVIGLWAPIGSGE